MRPPDRRARLAEDGASDPIRLRPFRIEALSSSVIRRPRRSRRRHEAGGAFGPKTAGDNRLAGNND
jgi:hypothetical protein